MKRSIWVLTLVLLQACAGGGGPVVNPPPGPTDSGPPVVIEQPIPLVNLNVIVHDEKGHGIVNTLVLLDEQGEQRTTDGAGFVNFGVPIGKHTLVVKALGYKVYATTLDVTDDTTADVGLVLDRIRQVRGRLQAQARALTYPDSAPFRWRFATGFRLLEQVAHRREHEAEQFLQWARATGFNGVRVLCMANGLFQLTPADGLAALPRFLELADEHDLYVELVALADTRAYNMTFAQMTEQVRTVGAIAAKHPNAVVQIANEHYHPTQVDELHDATNLARLAAVLPPTVLYTLSAASGDEDLEPQGEYVTRHLGRGRDQWNNVRRVRELGRLSQQTSKHVVDDEPIGADEHPNPGKRLNDPAVFFTFGVLGRIFETGSTFHFQAGLFAQLPLKVQAACAKAFIAGATLIPDDVRLTFRNAGEVGSPVARACFIDPGPASAPGGCKTVIRVFSGLMTRGGVVGRTGYTVVVGIAGDPGIEWMNGWKPTREVVKLKGVSVWEIVR